MENVVKFYSKLIENYKLKSKQLSFLTYSQDTILHIFQIIKFKNIFKNKLKNGI